VKLTSEEFTLLHDALLDAFDDHDALEVMLARAGKNLAAISAPGKRLDVVVMKVIRDAESRDRIDWLVAAARTANRTNKALATVAAAIGLEPGGVAVTEQNKARALSDVTSSLERMVDPDRGIADFGSYAEKILDFLMRVCAVELGKGAGTGFLIGPDTVLTNYHVVEAGIKGTFDPANIVLRFDYRRLRDGRTTNAGVEVPLAKDWLVDCEPYSRVDLRPYDENDLPADNQLDYAVLKARDQIGLQPPSRLSSEQRGWLTPLPDAYQFPVDSFLMIVQHPCNDPISFDSTINAVLRMNPNSTRVHYRTNTLPGSSGSPVLNRDLDLVGLHHAGEPGSPDQFKPCHQQITPAAYNEGIPISKIHDHIAAKGLAQVFGQEG